MTQTVCCAFWLHIFITWGIFVHHISPSCTSSPCNLVFLNLGVQLFSHVPPGDRVDATMKGLSEKGGLFAILLPPTDRKNGIYFTRTRKACNVRNCLC